MVDPIGSLSCCAGVIGRRGSRNRPHAAPLSSRCRSPSRSLYFFCMPRKLALVCQSLEHVAHDGTADLAHVPLARGDTVRSGATAYPKEAVNQLDLFLLVAHNLPPSRAGKWFLVVNRGLLSLGGFMGLTVIPSWTSNTQSPS